MMPFKVATITCYGNSTNSLKMGKSVYLILLMDICISAYIVRPEDGSSVSGHPTSTKIFLIGDFNGWKESEEFELKPVGTFGNWEIKLPLSAMKHGDLYKMKVYWDGGSGERIPCLVSASSTR